METSIKYSIKDSMNYLVLIISFNFLTIEYHVTEDFILRKASTNNPEVSSDIVPPLALLDQKNGKLYTVDMDCNYRVESQFTSYETGWQSDQYDLKDIATHQCIENGWSCVDIIESKSSSDRSPFGSGDEFKTITRICRIPELASLIKDVRYYKFFGFYRTDIDLPFKGIVTKQWFKSSLDLENVDHEVTIIDLKEIYKISGISDDIESVLKLPIQHR